MIKAKEVTFELNSLFIPVADSSHSSYNITFMLYEVNSVSERLDCRAICDPCWLLLIILAVEGISG